MTALDFPPNTAHPAAPAIGDKWPAPAEPNKPVYIWDGFKWSTLDVALNDVVGPSATIPLMNAGDGATGSEANWSRGDHVHPAKVATPATSDNSTSIATTAFVKAAIIATPPGAPTSNIFPVGTFALLTLKTGQSVAADATISGINLSQPIWSGDAANGYVVQGGISGPQQTGTWKNMSGLTIGVGSTAGTGNFVGYFVRTA